MCEMHNHVLESDSKLHVTLKMRLLEAIIGFMGARSEGFIVTFGFCATWAVFQKSKYFEANCQDAQNQAQFASQFLG